MNAEHPYTESDIRDLIASGHWPADSAEPVEEETAGEAEASEEPSNSETVEMKPAEPQPALTSPTE